jgi:hypothetical protein
MATQYVLRTRQPDGSWKFDMDTPMSKREAEHSQRVGRIAGGMISQIWTEKEAVEIVAKHEAAASAA